MVDTRTMTVDYLPDLSKEEYEDRFWQRYDSARFKNALGYGKKNPFIPPL